MDMQCSGISVEENQRTREVIQVPRIPGQGTTVVLKYSLALKVFRPTLKKEIKVALLNQN